MTETGFARIDHYLLGEMDAKAIEEFESDLLGDDGVYFAVIHRENELVDRYAAMTLDADLATRLERSSAALPTRQQKLANAKALRAYISETSESASMVDDRVPWYERLGFTFKMPAYAAGALGLLLIGAVGFLMIQNRGLQNNVSSLQKNAQVDELIRREAELKSQLEEQQLSTGDLTSDLESERDRRAKLEAEVGELRKKSANSGPAGDKPLVPTIATIILRPVSVRGESVPVRRLELEPTQKRVSVRMILPGTVGNDGRVSITLNGETVAKNVRPTVDANGTGSVTFAVPTDRFRKGMNKIGAVDDSGTLITEFPVLADRK